MQQRFSNKEYIFIKRFVLKERQDLDNGVWAIDIQQRGQMYNMIVKFHNTKCVVEVVSVSEEHFDGVNIWVGDSLPDGRYSEFMFILYRAACKPKHNSCSNKVLSFIMRTFSSFAA